MSKQTFDVDIEIEVGEAVNLDGVVISQTMLREVSEVIIPRQSIPEIITTLQKFYEGEGQ